MKDLVDKIKQKGYWRIKIRPTEYDEKRIKTIEECINIIKTCVVTLRGWDYPHIDRTGIRMSGNDSIESLCDWPEGGHYEYWRFYQSGQFVHYFSMREDYAIDEERLKKIQKDRHTKSEKYLDILSALYSVTEIYQFAKNLVAKNIMGEEIEVIVELGGAEGRELFFWDSFMRHLFNNYICAFRDENIIVKRIVKKEDVLAHALEISLGVTMEIFKKFNWIDVPANIFTEDQKKYIERRL
jgi:hypothetical protein